MQTEDVLVPRRQVADVLASLRAFVCGDVFLLLVCLVTYGFLVFGQTVGAFCTLFALLILLLFLMDDTLPLLLPFLLLLAVSLLMEKEMAEYPWLFFFAVPAVPALLFRLLRGLPRARRGGTFYPLIGVSLAVALGGVGHLSPDLYFSAASFYHIAGLGVCMIFFYLLFVGGADAERTYDARDKFAMSFYLLGVFLAFLILRVYLSHVDWLEGGGIVAYRLGWDMPWRNVVSNLIVLLLPFIFYYARRHGAVHLLSACLVYLGGVFSTSRGALISGGVMMVLGFFYVAYGRPHALRATVTLLAALFLLGAVFYPHLHAFADRFLRVDGEIDWKEFFSSARVKLARHSLDDFLSSPLVGMGLGNHIYSTEATVGAFCIEYYHSLLPQILGSLGLCGVAAYGFQFYRRLRALLAAPRDAFTAAAALSYFGMLMYAQVDPSIFSPLPFAALAVLLFVAVERHTAAAA